MNTSETTSLDSDEARKHHVMKCFFNLSGSDNKYYEMAKVLILSAVNHTNLELFCVFDGKDRNFSEWMKHHGVTVLYWKITFLSDLIVKYNGKMSIDFCRGTYLCMELPKILEEYEISDNYFLYIDIDIIFTGDIRLEEHKPTYFYASNDWGIDDMSRFSTGVLVMNKANLLADYPEFINHLSIHNYNFEYAGMGPCDQGAWNTFYCGKNEYLNPIYDWKPWWGKNEDAKIIHFSGPKPRDIARLLKTGIPINDKDRMDEFVINQDPDAYHFYLKLWEGYMRDT